MRGFALIPALFLIVVLGALAVVAVRVGTGQQQAVIMSLEEARALAAAQAGIEWGAYQSLSGDCRREHDLELDGGVAQWVHGHRHLRRDLVYERRGHRELVRPQVDREHRNLRPTWLREACGERHLHERHLMRTIAPIRVWLLAAAILGGTVSGARPAAAQIAYVQSSGLFGNNAGTVATSTAFATNPKVGDTIVVLLWTWTENTAANIQLTDSMGNTYTSNTSAVILQSGNWYESANVYSTKVVKTGAGFTLTITLSGNDSESQSRAVALEYSGVGAVDQANAATGSVAAASVSTTAATKYANELVVSTFGVDNPADDFSTITPSSGFTTRAVEYQNAGDTAGAAADKMAATTGIQSNTWTVSPTLSGWAAAIATFAPGSIQPDHYAISDAGTAVNCQASPVTITAMSSTQTPVATTNTITVSTSTGHGDWSLTTGAGSFTAGASNSGTATYTYVSADAGVVTLSLKDTYAETVTINVTDGTATQKTGSALASQQPPLTFVASGFRVTNGANVAATIGTQIAGKTSTQSLALQAVRTDTNTGACTSVFASGTTANISLAYQCNNPTTCIAGQTLSITNNATTTNIASNPASGVSTYTTVPLKFSTANAEALFSLSYSDAGQITLYARYNIPLSSGAGSGNLMNGSSQFVAQPYTFVLSNLKCTTYGAGTCSTALGAPGNDPGAASAAGAAFVPAGEPFSATATAQNFLGAATPNYGQELAPPGVTLSANLIAPSGGDAAALNNASAFGAWSGGVATGTTFNWAEVGIITLTPAVANYLGSGAVTGTTSGNVGRFYPSNFSVALNTPVFGTTCGAGSFSYLGQPLTYTVAPVATVTAQALGGATTRNYTGAFMKLTNSSLTGRSYTPTPASPSLNVTGLPAATADPAIADLGTGPGDAHLQRGHGSALQSRRRHRAVQREHRAQHQRHRHRRRRCQLHQWRPRGQSRDLRRRLRHRFQHRRRTVLWTPRAARFCGLRAPRPAAAADRAVLPRHRLWDSPRTPPTAAPRRRNSAFSNYQLNLHRGRHLRARYRQPRRLGRRLRGACARRLAVRPGRLGRNFQSDPRRARRRQQRRAVGHRHRAELAAVFLGGEFEPGRDRDVRGIPRTRIAGASARSVLEPRAAAAACRPRRAATELACRTRRAEFRGERSPRTGWRPSCSRAPQGARCATARGPHVCRPRACRSHSRAQRAGRVAGRSAERFLRREAEQGTGHVKHQQERGARRGARDSNPSTPPWARPPRAAWRQAEESSDAT